MNHSSIKITPLSKTDYELWLILWQNYLTFYETSLPSGTTETTWRNLLDKGKLENDMPTKKAKHQILGFFYFDTTLQ
ncbi:hypothetical protein [Psychrobacter pacificensis]|uniref:Uncharacterized protein n=1 Tax=Psychrobacter pacificensis TaxID=112002 RepID=A0A1G6UZX5_9GAMM|nr:hypothetical protein [Psychrobacter pacificensis]GLR28290.1 hypothetical protein GCM10007915_05280 [Psychrobacter pacificensis]SDD46950.1 hypothetical protein SAMN05660405_00392 [Psychrobacter pacificensis]|tara:strand:+ start:2014 stop:2244 length:231 start_codon:yes stop_codon:yes gene_type:complete